MERGPLVTPHTNIAETGVPKDSLLDYIDQLERERDAHSGSRDPRCLQPLQDPERRGGARMSKVLVKITAEVYDTPSLQKIGTFQVTDMTDLETGDKIAQAVDFVLEIADDATRWEKVA